MCVCVCVCVCVHYSSLLWVHVNRNDVMRTYFSDDVIIYLGFILCDVITLYTDNMEVPRNDVIVYIPLLINYSLCAIILGLCYV